jgi:uncharacterized protein (TIGR02145 family)
MVKSRVTKVLILCAFMLSISINNSLAQPSQIIIKDLDNHSYTTVKLGNNLWSTENLKSTKFRNGDVILHAKNINEWEDALTKKKAAWCYFNWDKNTHENYGKIYNMYAIQDPRGLAPVGCKIPDVNDWIQLQLEHQEKNKENFNTFMSDSGWRNHNSDPKNGFNAYPNGGLHIYLVPETQENEIVFNNSHSSFWSSDIFKQSEAFVFNLPNYTSGLNMDYVNLAGYPIRFVIEKTSHNQKAYQLYQKGSGVKDIDNNVYETVIINEMEWTTTNLDVSKFNDGTPIPLAKKMDDWEFNDKNIIIHKITSAYYAFDEKYKDVGRFYSKMVVESTKNVCPIGWHIATHEEWSELEKFITTFFHGFGNASLPPPILKTNHKHPSIQGLINYNNGLNLFGLALIPGGQFGGENIWRNVEGHSDKWRLEGFNSFGAAGTWWRMGVHPKNQNKIAFATRMYDYQNRNQWFYSDRHYPSGADFAQIRCVKNSEVYKKMFNIEDDEPTAPEEVQTETPNNTENKRNEEVLELLDKARRIFGR